MGELGLYGIRLAGLRDRAPDEPAPPADWERWTFAQVTGPADDAAGMSVEDGRARVGLPGTGELCISRADRRIDLNAPVPVPATTVEHPLLVPAAAAVAHWQGRAAVHAAAVVVGDRAWGILGERGAGKSTLAANLVRLGAGPFADDLLVIAGDVAFAGPPFVDLRADVAVSFPAQALGVVGERERWRLPAPTERLVAPLAGWIALEDHDGELPPHERLRRLDTHLGLPLPAPQLLALADHPMLARRRGEDAERVLAAITR